MIKNVIVACCDNDAKKIVVENATALLGESHVKICKNSTELYQMVKYAENTAVILDKYFFGYVISYSITRLSFLNDKVLTYFVEIGDCSPYLAIRLYELGITGFISNIECNDVLKNNITKIQTGLKCYPEIITRRYEDEDYDRKCITEVTATEMEIGMHLGKGKSQKEICYLTGLSRQTVNSHIHRLKRKIGYTRPTDFDLLTNRYFKQMGGEIDN